nr:DUF6660 family protein [Chryseobacterium sp.]
MVLSITPCTDTYSPSNNKGIETLLSIDASHSKDNGDICSPLCSCNCCQITVTVFKIDPLLKLPIEVRAYFSKKILFHNTDFAYQVYDHIWQPPKI